MIFHHSNSISLQGSVAANLSWGGRFFPAYFVQLISECSCQRIIKISSH